MTKKQPLLRKDAPTMNHFQMDFKEVKVTETGSIKIKGFASTPDIDRYDDIIKPEAFANAMKTYMQNPTVLLGHDTSKPIGLVTEYNLTTNGLEVTCEIMNDEDGCFEKIQNKTLRGFSIGWRCIDCIYKEEGNKYIREVTNLDLAEISVVAVPANPQTLFTLAKSLKKFFDTKDAQEKKEETPVETPKVEETPTEAPVETVPETKEEPIPTETETPAVETPPKETEPEAKAEGEDPIVEEEGKGEDVKPVEEAEPAPTEEEVKALVDLIVREAVEKAVAPLLSEIKELKNAFDSLEKKTTAIENDVLSIEVKPSSRKVRESKSIVLSDALVMSTLGH